jgi:DNA-binding NtrC family response regulator
VRGPSGPPAFYRFEQDAIAIGRAPSNDLVLQDPMLSRFHVEIRREAERWVVADRGSLNGTRLNGHALARPESIAAGDEIALGGIRVSFESQPKDAVPEGHPDSTWAARGAGAAADDLALIGQSPALRQVADTIERIAASDATVLVTGESGTGKGLVSRLLHARSARARGPFVKVNCPALPGSLLEAELFGIEAGVATGVTERKGRFEGAPGGTLFLDEIGDMDLVAQAKILQFLDERTVERVGSRKPLKLDVRLVAATNHDLEADIAKGTFRRDLFHRLDVVSLHLPTLRERREDVPVLVDFFLSRLAPPTRTVAPAALDLLVRHDYPGNVRELEHLVERACLLAEGLVLQPADFPRLARGGATTGSAPADPRSSAVGAEPAAGDRLYDLVVTHGGSFWDLVQQPYLERELPRAEVRGLILRAYRESGYSYKGVARLFRIEAEHKKLLNFLRNQHLGVR